MSKVNSLKLNEPDYPELLLHIHSPPAWLFWTGIAPQEFISKPKVAIVGSRKASAYGKQVTERLAGELARAGVVIISGLAFGIDATAHRAALSVGGCTVAVLPAPLDKIYPAAHHNLAKQIVSSSGALVSEYPPGSEVYKENFIARNRIVSGLADVLVITEAAKNSGSLHTARFALEQGKTVMAVPGNIYSPTSEGCNNLINSGAGVVRDVDDIFLALNLKPKARTIKRVFKGTTEEQLLFDLIRGGVNDQDDLAARSGMSGQALNSALSMLEINGHIKADAGHWTLQ
ncbi:DNA-protecting protein DprA [Candidatus Saccharibacteria bacterium]|nr:DNA-protecting protein DprA [Candidatus Saccharibacteria bacterium]